MIIVDTREPSEYTQSHVEGAINIPPAEFLTGDIPAPLKRVPKDEEIIVYCRSGQRSNTCGAILSAAGFTNITNGVSEHRVAQLLERR